MILVNGCADMRGSSFSVRHDENIKLKNKSNYTSHEVWVASRFLFGSAVRNN